MTPKYWPGDMLLTVKGPFWGLHVGQNVVIRHPYYHSIVKQIIEVLPSGDFKVSGINPLSTPSEAIGVVQTKWVLGQVIMHFPAKRIEKGAVQ
jgi:hypothetical protein